MKKITILILAIALFACSKDKEIEQSKGTKLITIKYRQEDKNWIENYSYSSDDKIDIIETFYSLGRRYEIEYQNDRVKEFSTYIIDDDKLVFRDSILYNSDGTIHAIYNFSINSGIDLSLSTIYEFEYDSQNKLSKLSRYFVATEDYSSIEKYYWSGNNIEKVEYFNGDEELYYEFFYEYDDKVNYKKGLPINLFDPINWCDNNVVKMNWIDHLGNLDLICRPCLAKYKYNLDNYPIEINYNWGRMLELEYE